MENQIITKIKELTLRFATKNDIPLILEFIKKLAEYEKLSHEVVANAEILQKSLFGKRQFAEVIIAEYETIPAGFALFFHNFSTFLGRPGIYIEDLYVIPEMRGKGIGKIILSLLARIAIERDCGRLEWWVLNWNKHAINFYIKHGAQPMDDWTVFRITGQSLVELSDYF